MRMADRRAGGGSNPVMANDRLGLCVEIIFWAFVAIPVVITLDKLAPWWPVALLGFLALGSGLVWFLGRYAIRRRS